MFKLGIYSKQLTIIAVLLGILCLGQIAKMIDNMFAPASATPVLYPQQTTLIKSASTNTAHVCVDPDHSSCDGNCECDGLGCSKIGQDFSQAQLLQEYNNGMMDYQLLITDNGNKLVLYDNGKPVHVFDRAYKPNSNLFHVIDRDNW